VRLSKTEESTIRARARAAGPKVKPSCYVRGRALDDAPGSEAYTGERCGVLRTPQGIEPACYEVRDVEALITSHNPTTWERDKRYPEEVQERDYRADQNERLKVEGIAAAPDERLVSLTPTAVDGPPVVASSGVVLGGNGRTMGLRLAYARGTAAPYVALLRERAPVFGLHREDVDAVARPVLVRVVKGLDHAARAELADASSRYNDSLTNTLDERARAVSLSHRISAETRAAVGNALEEHESLRAAMAAAGPVFVGRFTTDGIITSQNRSSMVDGSGGLTELGKMTVEGAFLGLVAGSPERLAQASASTLGKVERLVPFLARVSAKQDAYDLTPGVQAAMDLVYRASVANRPVREFAGQGDMFGSPPPLRVVLLADALATLSARKLADAARAWVKVADFDPRQATMFDAPKTPGEALVIFLDAAGQVLTEAERAELLRAGAAGRA
jgi:hypothetical protein